MKNIHDLFHEIGNMLNKISTRSGAAILLAKHENALGSQNMDTVKSEYKKLLDEVAFAEKTALTAGEQVEKLKVVVYETLKLDPENDK